MIGKPKILAVIPARGGSKGLPGKNIRPFAGLPLISHSILFSQMCTVIDRCIVSTDSEEIASVAKEFGAEIPFKRPPELATDESAMGPVLQHALNFVENEEGTQYDMLLLLDPTCPSREVEDVTKSYQKLIDAPSADGVIGVCQMEYSPHWECVVEHSGWMRGLIEGSEQYTRRQDVPVVYHINGMVYLWRAGYLKSNMKNWRDTDSHLMHIIPESRWLSINTLFEFQRAEAMVTSGLIKLPWLGY